VRIQVGDASIAYTGDGELSDALVQLVSGADLLIAESYFYDKPVKGHLNYPDIARLDAKRIVLTHMHTNMLRQMANVPEACACDGYVLSVRG
jgi:ribonuclease BN (tRNA processing enzyme)